VDRPQVIQSTLRLGYCRDGRTRSHTSPVERVYPLGISTSSGDWRTRSGASSLAGTMLPSTVQGRQFPPLWIVLSLFCLCQRRLGLGQPERHVHGAVQLDGGDQLDVGLLAQAFLEIQRAQA
jgi:hypothetical protein